MLFKLIQGVLRLAGCGDSPSPRAKRAHRELKTAHRRNKAVLGVVARAREVQLIAPASLKPHPHSFSAAHTDDWTRKA
jgi:hypothetical protein